MTVKQAATKQVEEMKNILVQVSDSKNKCASMQQEIVN